MSSNSLNEAINAHDLALEAIGEAQEQLPSYLGDQAPLNSQQTEWLSTFALVFQSLDVPRSLILSAAYAPAAAILKQEWDGIYVLSAIRTGKIQYEKSPNIKNFLGLNPYSQHQLLQPIAHLTGKNLGYAWAVQSDAGVDRFIPTPIILPEVSFRLFNARSYLLCHLYFAIREFLNPLKLVASDEKIRDAAEFLNTVKTD